VHVGHSLDAVNWEAGHECIGVSRYPSDLAALGTERFEYGMDDLKFVKHDSMIG
jgi:hypothetical protein